MIAQVVHSPARQCLKTEIDRGFRCGDQNGHQVLAILDERQVGFVFEIDEDGAESCIPAHPYYVFGITAFHRRPCQICRRKARDIARNIVGLTGIDQQGFLGHGSTHS